MTAGMGAGRGRLVKWVWRIGIRRGFIVFSRIFASFVVVIHGVPCLGFTWSLTGFLYYEIRESARKGCGGEARGMPAL